MADSLEGAPPARPAAAAQPMRRVPARLKQLPFRSQAKIVLTLAAPTTAILYGLFVVLALGGFFDKQEDISFGIMLVALALVSAMLGAALAAIQVAALGLLRLMPWQGPSLEIEEPRTDLAGIFE